MNFVFELSLIALNVLLVEPHFAHCFVQGKHQGVALFENSGVDHALHVVENVGAPQLQGVEFEVFVLYDFDQLADLVLA